MPSNPSALLRLELQATGENVSVWGTKLNALFTQVSEAVASFLPVTITGDLTLTSDNYLSNQYRRAGLILNGTPAAPFTITVPQETKGYWIINNTGQVATFKTAAGGGALTSKVRVGLMTFVICDATNCFSVDPTLDQIAKAAAAIDANGQKVTNAANGSVATDLMTIGQAPTVLAPQVQLASDWAQKTSGTVDGTEYSAKLWATSTTALTGGNKGAKGYAADAASSASAASGSASAANTSAGNAATSATNAASSATAADTSAQASASQALSLSGTSSTSQTIGFGSFAFTTQSGKAFGPGTRLLIASSAAPANYFYGTSTAYSGTSLTLNATATGGAGATAADWVIRVSGERGPAGPSGSVTIPRSARTSNTALAPADLGSLIDLSGTFTQTVTAAATLGAGWSAFLRNPGAGIVTLDPNGAETVDGLTTIRLYPGESLTLVCDGTAFYTIGRPRANIFISGAVISTSVAAVDFTSGLDDTEFKEFVFDLEGVTMSATGFVAARFKQNGAFVTSGYTAYALTGITDISNGGTVMGLHSSAANAGLIVASRQQLLAPFSNVASVPRLFGLTAPIQGNPVDATMGSSASANAVQAVRFLHSAGGNLTGGAIRLYGQR